MADFEVQFNVLSGGSFVDENGDPDSSATGVT